MKNSITGVLFIDLKSAFDTVPHERLLNKVNELSIFDTDEENLLKFLTINAHVTIG